MELIIIGVLILINGFFAVSEMSLVAAKRVRLETLAKKGSPQAKAALDLSEHPGKFLSTVQIGITIIGILIGIFSGDKITTSTSALLAKISFLAPYSQSLGVGVVVVCVTYFSVLFGELLPKRIGMTYPETIAKKIALPMKFITKVTLPLGWLLTKTSDMFINLFNIRNTDESKVTEEEIKAIIQEGKEGGEVQEIEQDIVERVFMLGDRRVSTLMTPRSQVVMLEGTLSIAEILPKVSEELHSIYPIYEEDKDNITGIVKLKDLFANINKQQVLLKDITIEAHFVLEKTTAFHALERFKSSKVHYGIVIDEYGQMQGIITLNDLLESLIGYSSEFYSDDYTLHEREDGTWLLDGHYPFPDFLHYFDLEDVEDEEHNFDTCGGLILNELGRIPEEGDKLEWRNFEMEIIDMDGTRIDKILLKKKDEPPRK